MTPSTIKTGAMMTMARRRLLCYRVVVVATTLCSLVVGFSIQHHPRQRIRPASSASDDYEETSKYTKRRPRRIRPKRSAAATAQTEIRKAEAKQRHAQALQDPTLLSNVVFAERDDLHPSTKRALTETMGLRQMTEIQLKTYAAAFTGKSVLGRSKTGTGKSLAFLLPSLERLLQGNISLYHPGRNIGVLVIAPTRELAIQIADQARLLLTYHSQDFTVMDMYGGTKLSRDTALLNKRLPTILVATPGRLLDHIEQTRVGARRFSDILSQTQIVVLDETDRLLVDMGFQRDVKKILSFLPRPAKRQTLMFSATLPKRLVKNMKDALSDDYVQVDCVDTHRKNTSASRNGSTVTNIRVKQTFLLLPNMDSYMSKLIEILLDAIRSTPNDYKILVFFPANKLVKFFADVCNAINDSTLPQIQQLHSHMTQSARQRTSTDFAKVQQAILFTSDVSARGVDYPDVTHVIQVSASGRYRECTCSIHVYLSLLSLLYSLNVATVWICG